MKTNLEEIRVAAQVLVNRAAAAGVVVTIEQKPLEPLAMGNYASVVSVREVQGHLVSMPMPTADGHACAVAKAGHGVCSSWCGNCPKG